MSQIFDALLRSETERDGNDPAARSEATELLRSVENHASSQWESSVPTISSTGTGLESGFPFERVVVPSQPDSFPAQGVLRGSWNPEPADLWSRFRTIHVAPAAEGRLVCLNDEVDATAEAFRLLGVRLRDLRRTRPLNKLLITSTVPQEGKSTVVANLGCTLAHITGEKILLVEGDIRRPSLTRIFSLGEVTGLCELLRGTCSLAECIYRVEGTGIWILPAGKASAAPLELMQSNNLPKVMDQLAALFEWVIVDSPPVLPLADTSIWMRIAEGILLVTRHGVTEKKQLERGLRALDPNKVIGALLNSSHASSYSSYYYKSPTAS